MEKIHLENIDPRPKRRIHKDNPYRIFSTGQATGDPHYYIKFLDAQGVEICIEISRELFDYFDNCELADLSLLNECDRHTDKTELSPYLLNIITNQSQDPLLDITAKSQEERELRIAILMLPDKQRRRLLMHYWGDMTYQEIAVMEGCSPQAIEHSLRKAQARIKIILKNFHKGG